MYLLYYTVNQNKFDAYSLDSIDSCKREGAVEIFKQLFEEGLRLGDGMLLYDMTLFDTVDTRHGLIGSIYSHASDYTNGDLNDEGWYCRVVAYEGDILSCMDSALCLDYKIGDAVYWNDPSSKDYGEDEAEAKSRVFLVVDVLSDDTYLITDGHTEAEVYSSELSICNMSPKDYSDELFDIFSSLGW